MKIILASGSPRRRELLSMITDNFEVMVSHVEERVDETLAIEEQVKQLAMMKAEAVFESTAKMGNRIVIGCDSLVVKEGKKYGKPKNKEDAWRMIQELKNAKHEVMTGVCLMIQEENQVMQKVDIDITSVYVKDMTEKEMEAWIATGEAYDKAGGYAIQGKFGVHIEKIEGNYYNVVGFPVQKVYEMLKPYLEQ